MVSFLQRILASSNRVDDDIILAVRGVDFVLLVEVSELRTCSLTLRHCK